jgi:hypothetical protein
MNVVQQCIKKTEGIHIKPKGLCILMKPAKYKMWRLQKKY